MSIDPRTTSTARRTAFALLGSLAAAAAAIAGVAAPAHAEDDWLPDISVTPASTTAPYGQGWSVSATAKDAYMVIGPWTGGATISGAPSGYAMTSYAYAQNSTTVLVQAGPSGTHRPLPAGKYIITPFVADGSGYTTTATTPATLTIAPAAVGIEARIVDNPSNQTSAIVTARFTGDFLDFQYPSAYPTAPLKPAGIWSIIISDDSGAVAAEFQAERLATDDALATSFYWADPSPGGEYTVSATFAQTSDSARNYTIDASVPFDYTASTEVRAIPVSEVVPRPQSEAPPEPDFSVPLWWVLLIGLALAALMTFAVVFAIRLGRLPRKTDGGAVLND